MADTLTGIARAVGDLMRVTRLGNDPDPAAALALAERLEEFAADEPRLSPDSRINLLTQLARTVDPAAPRDADQALALLRSAGTAAPQE